MYELSCVLIQYRACTVCAIVLIFFLSICKAVRFVESRKNLGTFYVSILRRSNHTGLKKRLGKSPSTTNVYYPIGSTFGKACAQARIKSSSSNSRTKAKDVAAAIKANQSLTNHVLTMVSETDPPVMTLTNGGVQENLICTSQYPISPLASLLMIDEDDDLVSGK